ncbi:ATP-binding cassette domain-containing protein [Sorangium sp. So ce1335]|uniref:ATP-binding cassette domain-containing protein n=1 Tax=Sorangium sp. So ce1335 TaxID=3133335 RepID=UPI003F624966
MSDGSADARGIPLVRFLVRQGLRIKGYYIATLTSWVVVYALPLVIGSTAAALIDKAGGKPMNPGIWGVLALVVALMALRAIALLLGLQLTFETIFRTSAWLKVDVLDRLLRRPSSVVQAGSGEILNRLRDDTEEIGSLLEWTTDLIYRSVLTVIAVTVLATTDLVMTIPLALLASGLLVSAYLKGRVTALRAETRRQQGRIGSMIADSLHGIRDLRLAGAVENHLARLETRFDERRRVLVRQRLFADLLSNLFRNLVLVGTSVVLVTMSLRRDGDFDVGKLVLFLTYSSWLGQQMYFFGKILAAYQNGKVSYGRLSELYLDGLHETAAAPGSAEPLRAFVVDGFTFRAPPGASAPAPVSFQVRPGELVAITGEIGAGKSRLLHGLLGLDPDVVGRVRWNEVDVTGKPEAMRAPQVAYAAQSPRFLRGTLAQNIVLGSAGLTATDLEAIMRIVQLDPGSAELTQGLDTKLDSGDAGQLSGGQRQRLALARMLARRAELFLVDACDSSLDGPTARRIWQAMRADRRSAWIVVSQNPDLLALADRVVVLTRSAS